MGGRRILLGALAGILIAGTAAAQELRIGLADDIDFLDPARERTTVARLVMQSMCNSLFDIDENMNIVGELASTWSWSDDNLALTIQLRQGVNFHDGTPFNAEAAAFNLDRSRTMETSVRKTDLEAVSEVVVDSEYQITIKLKAPFSPLIAKLASSPGTMISPARVEELGEDFSSNPSCTGPYTFVERVPQERVVLQRNPDHWDAANYHFERIIFLPIPDGTVRLANLEAGDIDILDRVNPVDVARLEGDSRFKVQGVDSLGYQSLIFNLTIDNPVAKDVRVRRALELAIDRQAIVDVVFSGQATVGNQFWSAATPYYNPDFPVPGRDVEQAKALLAEAGHERVAVEILAHNNPINVQVAQMIQSMAAEAGFDITLNIVEFATSLNMTEAGDFEIWGPIGPGGLIDADGVTYMSLHSTGNRNVGEYADPKMDEALDAARQEGDPARQAELYQQAMAVYQEQLPIIYLYHLKFVFAHTAGIEGFHAWPDGLMRLNGVRFAG